MRRWTRRRFCTSIATVAATGHIAGCICTPSVSSPVATSGDSGQTIQANNEHLVWIAVSGIPRTNGERSLRYDTKVSLSPPSGSVVPLNLNAELPASAVWVGSAVPGVYGAAAVLWDKLNGQEVMTRTGQLSIERGFPASAHLRFTADNVAVLTVGTVEYVLDRESSLLAVLVSDAAAATSPETTMLLAALESRGAFVDRTLRSTTNGYSYYLVDVGRTESFKTSLDLLTQWARNGIGAGQWQDRTIGVVVYRSRQKRVRILAPVRSIDFEGVRVRSVKLNPPESRPGNPVDGLVGRSATPLSEWGLLEQSTDTSGYVTAAIQGSGNDWRSTLGLSDSMAKLSNAGRLTNGAGLLDGYAVATIDEAPIDCTHPRVDVANLIQVVLCGHTLGVSIAPRSMAQVCNGVSFVANARRHATAVYGMLSALSADRAGDPEEEACGPGGTPGSCEGGLLEGVPHIALAVPPTEGNISPVDACLALADALLWLAGLEPKQHPEWPKLSLALERPARIINISRRFEGLKAVDRRSWQMGYLVRALEDVAKSGCDGLGTLVVLASINSNQPFTETDAHLPCRSDMLVVGSCKTTQGVISSAELDWGPAIAVVAPSNSLRLLCHPDGADGICADYPGPAASFSAPMVAAAAAYVATASSCLTAPHIARMLRATASIVDVEMNSDEEKWLRFVDGRAQFSAGQSPNGPQLGDSSSDGVHCWSSLRYGQGCLNAVRATEMALAAACDHA